MSFEISITCGKSFQANGSSWILEGVSVIHKIAWSLNVEFLSYESHKTSRMNSQH